MLGWAGLRGAVPVVLATFPVIDGIPRSHEFFNIVFFVVLLSTIVQGTTFEPLAKRLGVTTDDPALPRPLAESGTIRRLGAEVLEFPVVRRRRDRRPRRPRPRPPARGGGQRDRARRPGDPAARLDARGGRRPPPRALPRGGVAPARVAARARWRSGPIGPRARPARQVRSTSSIFTARPWTEGDGDATRPTTVAGQEVIDLLRLRRDAPGSLVVLADGRYALCGPVLAVGARRQVTAWIERAHARRGRGRARVAADRPRRGGDGLQRGAAREPGRRPARSAGVDRGAYRSAILAR